MRYNNGNGTEEGEAQVEYETLKMFGWIELSLVALMFVLYQLHRLVSVIQARNAKRLLDKNRREHGLPPLER